MSIPVNYKLFSKNSFSDATAASSSAPSADTVTVSPCFTPRDISIISCVSFFVLPSFVMVHSDSNFLASFTRSPAGLAWIPTLSLFLFSNFFIIFSPFILYFYFYSFTLVSSILSRCMARYPISISGTGSFRLFSI